jgi:hypothetical protein
LVFFVDIPQFPGCAKGKQIRDSLFIVSRLSAIHCVVSVLALLLEMPGSPAIALNANDCAIFFAGVGVGVGIPAHIFEVFKRYGCGKVAKNGLLFHGLDFVVV